MNIFWGQIVLWHPWEQLSELRVDVLQWLHWHLWLSELLTLLKESQCCISGMIGSVDAVLPWDSQRLQLQAASSNEHLYPVPVKPLFFCCLFVCFTFEFVFSRSWLAEIQTLTPLAESKLLNPSIMWLPWKCQLWISKLFCELDVSVI